MRQEDWKPLENVYITKLRRMHSKRGGSRPGDQRHLMHFFTRTLRKGNLKCPDQKWRKRQPKPIFIRHRAREYAHGLLWFVVVVFFFLRKGEKKLANPKKVHYKGLTRCWRRQQKMLTREWESANGNDIISRWRRWLTLKRRKCVAVVIRQLEEMFNGVKCEKLSD